MGHSLGKAPSVTMLLVLLCEILATSSNDGRGVFTSQPHGKRGLLRRVPSPEIPEERIDLITLSYSKLIQAVARETNVSGERADTRCSLTYARLMTLKTPQDFSSDNPHSCRLSAPGV
jgi:hypothetical protein